MPQELSPISKIAGSQLVPIRELRTNPWNSNIVSPENEEKLDAALKRFGFFKPIVVRDTDSGLEILGGEHRWEAAKRIGLTEVPVFNVGPVDDVRAREISLADNARYGDDDGVALGQLLESIGTVEDIQTYLPYSDPDLRAMFNANDIALEDFDLDEDIEPPVKDDEKVSVPAAPKTHTIMHFKVSLADAEKLTALIAKTQKELGFTGSDDKTNAGDALVHLLISAGSAETSA